MKTFESVMSELSYVKIDKSPNGYWVHGANRDASFLVDMQFATWEQVVSWLGFNFARLKGH